MNFSETFNDLYDNDMKDDHLVVLSETSKTSNISIKTSVGSTLRKEKMEIITQGGSWAPLQCSVQVDSLGKECQNEGKALYIWRITL